LRTIGLLNDLAFARSWIANRRLLKPTSARKLRLELKQKQVAEEIIQEAMAEDETDEQEVLQQLIAKKRNQTKYNHDNLKLMQYLARQGFNYDAIKSALDNPSAQ
jgi:regulatory protein